MNKIKLWLLFAAFALAVAGCTSTTPVFYSNAAAYQDFIILGEATYAGGSKTGFQELLKAARKQYPTCDYVIDVMVDRKVIVFFFFKSETYTMRGTAIQYKK